MQVPKDWHLMLAVVGIVGIDLLITIPFQTVYALNVILQYGFYKSSVNVRVVLYTWQYSLPYYSHHYTY